MRRIPLVVLGVLLLLAAAWQARAALQAEPAPTPLASDSAAAADAIRAEGRLVTYPGAEVTLGSEIAGRIERVTVEEGARVAVGQLLVELGATEEQAALAEAQARLAEADAALRLADSEAARAVRLKDAAVISAQSLDHTLHELETARAHRGAADAAVRQLQARLAKSRLLSPLGGVVTTRSAEPGETVVPGRELLTIADLDRMRVEAEVDEFDAPRLRIGSPVVVKAEGYDGEWRGRVEEIPGIVTTRRLTPQDPARPTDTRVILVKVALEEPTGLRLGQRVELEIEAKP